MFFSVKTEVRLSDEEEGKGLCRFEKRSMKFTLENVKIITKQ